ncbi:lamin-B1-like [Glandiceps talaboti]
MSGFGDQIQQYSMSRTQEKSELQQLNDRFKEYLRKAELVRTDASQIDFSVLLASTSKLEKESADIKLLYEDEIQKLRAELEAVSANRQTIEAQNAAELEKRLAAEQHHNRELQDELVKLRQQLGSKDVQLVQVLAEKNDLMTQLEMLMKENVGLKRQLEEASGKYDMDGRALAEAREALAALQKKYDFERQVCAKELAEMKLRFDEKSELLLQMEVKLRNNANTVDNLPEMLERVRRAAHLQLEKYKGESEAEYTMKLNLLKKQLGQDASEFTKLAEESKILADELEEARGHNATLMITIRALDESSSTLAQSLEQERKKYSAHILALEAKIKELQNQLVVKLVDHSSIASGTAVPLTGEIESLKVLVEDAESKLIKSSSGGRAQAGYTVTEKVTYSTGHGGGTNVTVDRPKFNSLVGQCARNTTPVRSSQGPRLTVYTRNKDSLPLITPGVSNRTALVTKSLNR